jgi:hypothetical protein
MHPSNLIRVMPAQGRNKCRFPHREDPKAIAAMRGTVTADPGGRAE